jgi:hypothetical protein
MQKGTIILLCTLMLTCCLPDGDQTFVFSVIPKEFTKEWYANIRCQDATYDALRIAFNTEDQNDFEAKGTGTDYDESILNVKFKGYYNPSTDSLKGIFSVFDTDSTNITRIDQFQIKFGNYKGEVIPLTNTYMNSYYIGCNLEVSLEFSYKELTDSKKNVKTINENK